MKKFSRWWIAGIVFWLALSFLSGVAFGGWYKAMREQKALLSSTDVEQALWREGLSLVKVDKAEDLIIADVTSIGYEIGRSRGMYLSLFVCASEVQQKAVSKQWEGSLWTSEKDNALGWYNWYSVKNIFILMDVSPLELGIRDKMERAIVRMQKP